MQRQKKIAFAVVGCGHIGRRHAEVIHANDEADLVALCDIRPREELALEAFADIPFFGSLESLLAARTAVDVICVCTPNGLHAEQGLRILDAGHHVVIEKPMALRRSDCERIIHKALNASRQVFCVMQNRYSPVVQWLKQVVAEDRLGDIHLVQLSCLWNRDERYYFAGGQRHPWHGDPDLDGGVLFTQFAHFIDLLYWVFGDIQRIQTRLANFAHQGITDFADSGTVLFELERGGLGSLVFSTAVWDRNFASSLTVTGSKGSIQIGGQYMNELTACQVQDAILPNFSYNPPPNDYGGYQGSAANHQQVIQNVIDVLLKRKETTTNALEGLKVVDMIERIYAAADHPRF